MGQVQKSVFRNHFLRLKAGASQATALSEVSRWITDNTFLAGRHYSYRHHEYQPRILDSTAREVVVRKCSQVGISELAVRKALALCGMIKDFTVIYTLPTATFCLGAGKDAGEPVINESPYLSEMLTGTDSIEVKQFGYGSFLYLKGRRRVMRQSVSLPIFWCMMNSTSAILW
ncbi:MAG: hypothetical protein IPO40_25085 [Fibrobacteres bacterium]|nr:hypothetical protein [Fibrobacterota bacterium]